MIGQKPANLYNLNNLIRPQNKLIMRPCKLFFFLFSFLLFNILSVQGQNIWQYYFNRPASIWEESIPLGNGRIGMMPRGGVDRDRIVLNEISLWAGNKQDSDNPEAYKHLGEIRRLLFEKKNKEAQDSLA